MKIVTIFFMVGTWISIIFINAGVGQTLEYKGSTLWGGPEEIAVSGNYAYVTYPNGLLILDVSNPTQIVRAGQLYCQGNALGLEKHGNIVYLADGFGGLKIIDVTDPANPTLIGSSRPPSSALDVTVDSNLAYVTNQTGALDIIDISRPQRPFILGSGSGAFYALSIKLNDSYAYTADWGSDCMGVYDVSNYANPLRINHYDTGDNPWDIVIKENYAFVTEYGSVHIIDITDPYNLTSAGILYGYAQGIFISGDYAYLGCYYDSLAIINIADLNNPQSVGGLSVPAMHIAAIDTMVYTTGHTFGMSIVNASNPASPGL